MGSDTSYKSPAARIFPTGRWNVAEPSSPHPPVFILGQQEQKTAWPAPERWSFLSLLLF